MNGRNDTRDIEDDGFISIYPAPYPPPLEPDCLAASEEGGDGVCPKCLDGGYRRDWRGNRVMCDDCRNDNGPEF